MKLLFDESMPRPLEAYFPRSFEILTVQRMGWTGRSNGDLPRLAVAHEVEHESFFDYCSARLFFNRSESPVSFLKESEQHLFGCAQAPQAMACLPDADSARYVQEVYGLLSDERIRLQNYRGTKWCPNVNETHHPQL